VPLPSGQTLFLAACALLAAFGARRLALELGVDEAGARVAGLAWAFSGPLLSLLQSGHALSPSAMAFTVAAGVHAARCPGARSALFLALACGSQLLCGMPEVSACALLLSALCFAAEAAQRRQEGALSPKLGWAALGATLGAGLGAVQLCVTGAFVSSSSRAGGFELAEASVSALHPLRLLQLPFPFLFGSADAPGTPSWFFPVGQPPYLPEQYAGAVVVLCAILGLGARRLWPLLCGALGLAVLAMGEHTPLYRALFALLPPLRMMRYPEKLAVPLGLCIAVLAGAGFGRLRSLARQKGRARGTALAAGLALLLSAGAATLPHFGEGLLAALGPAREACVRATALPSITLGALLVAMVLGAVALARTGRLGPRALLGVLSLTLLLDLGWPALYQRPAALHEEITEPSPLIDRLSTRAGLPLWAFRASVERIGFSDRDVDLSLGRTRAAYLVRHAGLLDASAAAAGFYLDRGYSGFTPGGLRSLFQSADGAQVLDMLGVRFGVEVGRGPPRFERLGFSPLPGTQGALIRVFEKPAAREKLRLLTALLDSPKAGLLPRCGGEEAAWLAPAMAARLPAGLAAAPTCPQATGPSGAARIVRYLPEQVVAEVESPAPALAVLNDTYAPGWRAFVDGAEVPVLAADGAFRAAPVPAGRHTLRFDYRAPGLFLGAAISLTALLALLVLWLRSHRRTAPV
jgi:Bacterial membrane protein YfhO